MKNIFSLLLYLGIAQISFGIGLINTAPLDSIGTENKAGKWFILHKVEKGETFSSLSRRYKQTVSTIQNANPEMKNGLALGAIVKIPAPQLANRKEVMASKTAPKPKDDSKDMPAKTHTVSAGEGLFAIARKYKVTANDILVWNKLTKADAIKVGQVLLVSKPNERSSVSKEPENTIKPIKEEPNSIQPTQKPSPVKTNTQVDLSNAGFEKVVERGIAEVIEETKPSRMHLCLHKTAPEGTIIQVKNEQNGNTVFVRVIGKLPDTAENDRVILKISKKAFESLQALNKRFAVEISYNQAEGGK